MKWILIAMCLIGGLLAGSVTSSLAAPGDGEMTLDCAGEPVPGQCVYVTGSEVILYAGVIPPADGFSAAQFRLEWLPGVVSYNQPADPNSENVWGECNTAVSSIQPDGDLLWACVPQPMLPAPSLYTGPVAELSFDCAADGTVDVALVGNGGPLDSLFIQDPGLNLAPDVLHSLSVTCAPDSDGDGIPDPLDQDADNDGCVDWDDPNPLDFWDFFDTPDDTNYRDGAITSEDIYRVIARFGTEGDPLIDPLTPPPLVGYHTAFDRTYAGPLWYTGPSDGAVAATDIFLIIAQFGLQCGV